MLRIMNETTHGTEDGGKCHRIQEKKQGKKDRGRANNLPHTMSLRCEFYSLMPLAFHRRKSLGKAVPKAAYWAMGRNLEREVPDSPRNTGEIRISRNFVEKRFRR